MRLISHGDERGNLIALESNKNVPFEIKRVYYIYSTKEKVSRGFHAHRDLKQLLVAVSGSVDIYCEAVWGNKTIHLSCPFEALLLEGLVWREMHNFSKDAVLLVLASDYYNESDYIRSHDQFLVELRRFNDTPPQ